MSPLISIPAADVETSGMSLEVELPSTWISHEIEDAGARARADGKARFRLSKSGKADIVVRGSIAAAVEVSCARCLDPTPVDVQTELALLLKPRAAAPTAHEGPRRTGASKPGAFAKTTSPKKAAKVPEYEFVSEEAEIDEYDGERVVLDAFVREAILLELPSFPLCSESCPGIPGPAFRAGAPAASGEEGNASGADAGAGGSGAAFAPGARSPGVSDPDRSAESPEPGNPEPRAAFPTRNNPFEALRHLLPEGEGAGPAQGSGQARPSPAQFRKAARAVSKGKPRIRASIVGRNKK